MSDLTDWLSEELNNRGWEKIDLADRSGLSRGHIYEITNGKVLPGEQASQAIARAFEVPVEKLTSKIDYPVKQSKADKRAKFSNWLKQQIKEKGWSQQYVGRRSGLDVSYINEIIRGERNPGAKACRGIARALEIPEIIVFQQFGYITQDPAIDPTTETFFTILSQLSEEDQSELHEIARIKLARQNLLRSINK